MAIEIGQRVKVCRIRDRIPGKIVNQLKQNPFGTVKGFKMVDGSGIGFVVQLENSLSTWFFEDELESA
ncbi:MAG: cytochrome b6f subunit PetP [Limnospira sp.]